jgi:acetoin utilization deacetylase AcuC-like enzyme
MTGLVYDRVCQDHETGRHPECPDRLAAIEAELTNRGLFDRCRRIPAGTLSEAAICRIHSAEQLDLVRQAAKAGGGRIEVDTVVSARSFEVGLVAAGGCVAATDDVLTGQCRTAVSLTRPPGHHATPTQSMGFCLFNNVALAADHARRNHDIERVLIVDWDVHHGNGTQDIFYADPGVTFLSIHRYGGGFYPGTGSADETGTGRGAGTNMNLPIRVGTSARTILDRFRGGVEAAASACRPQLILVSAGFDGHRLDPIGGLGLETDDFVTLTQTVLDVASAHTGGRLVSCLEGGYHLAALAESVAAHLETLLAAEAG